MIRNFLACAAALLVGTVAHADTIRVTLTIPNVQGTIGPYGAMVPFTAPSITLTATADSQDLVTNPGLPPLYQLHVPMYFTMPGHPTATFYNSFSGVSVQDTGIEGTLSFGMTAQFLIVSQGARAQSPGLLGYNFATSIASLAVPAATWNSFSVEQSIQLSWPDGTVAFLTAGEAGTLDIEVLPPAAPALQSVVSRKTHGAAGVFDLP